MTTFDHIFRDFGLSEREVQIYLTLLEIGPQPASVLARRFGLPRSTAQFVAEKLATSGFVRKLDQKGVTTYAAKDANALRHFFETQKNNTLEQYRRYEEQLTEVTPMLNKLASINDQRPKVSYYQGVKEVQQLFEDVIATGEQVDFISAIGSTCPEIVKYLRESYVPRRKKQIKKDAPTRTIVVEGSTGSNYMAAHYDKQQYIQKVIAADVFNAEVNIQIYGNKVALYAARDAASAHGVLIQSDSISNALRSMFGVLWSVAQDGTVKKSPKKK